MLPIKKILVPIDASDVSLSNISLKALSWASFFTKESSITVYLIAVIENTQSMYDAYKDSHVLAQRKLKTFARVHEIFAEAEKQARDMGIKRIVRVTQLGIPYQKIIEVAADEKIDLIFMGTHGHGHSGISRLLAGNVTEEVIRRAPCPVLVCPTAHPHYGCVEW